jgi:hypothetical protein
MTNEELDEAQADEMRAIAREDPGEESMYATIYRAMLAASPPSTLQKVQIAPLPAGEDK